MKHILIICLSCIAFNTFSQEVSSIANKEATIIFSSTLSQSGIRIVTADSLFVRNSFVLEPIKIEFTETRDDVQKQTPSIPKKQLRWYYLTDLSELVGMGFDLKQDNPTKKISTFNMKSKRLGYNFSPEPFLFENGYNLGDYKKAQDTTVNGQACFVIIANKTIRITSNDQDDYLLYTKMIINPRIKDQNYSFISNAISEHFGGAIISVESRFKSGLSFNTKYHYKPQLSSEKKILFDKYQSIYLSNLDLLKKYKTNSKSK